MADLFDDLRPCYASAKFPPPRPFQETAHEVLRQGAREGHRCQMAMAPTVAGKSYLWMRVAHEALRKGRKATLPCDRRRLIKQTSKAADQYGPSHQGVLMADHWRADPSVPFQIASVQTAARRERPNQDVLVIDEAHTMHSTWVGYIQDCKCGVIEPFATPFTKSPGNPFRTPGHRERLIDDG